MKIIIKLKGLLLLGILFFLFFTSSAHDPLNWEFKTVPRLANVNSVQILDQNTIILAGGNESNDAIRNIFRSTDQGQTWGIILGDKDSAWLKSVWFINTFTGFVVGDKGSILKTADGGLSWLILSVPASVSTRNFNSVFFVNSQLGFMAGGKRSNDSIQTILKTIDGGNNWTVQRDTFGYWLKAIYFTDQSNGFAVGANGVVLKTTDAGTNWNQVALPGNASMRNFNTVFFLNASTGFIGGGNKSNDSIQTILKTVNGGNSWNIISDNLGSWITSIQFPTQLQTTTGFAVGDKGTVLITEDAGDTWNKVAIPNTINDTVRELRSVYFINLDFGLTAGEFGKMLIYKEPNPIVPSVETKYADNITLSSATMHGSVNANGSLTYVTFEYGTTPSLGSSVASDTVSGNVFTSVSANISGLTPGTVYYFRVKAQNNNWTAYSSVGQFYAGENPIPNWDFEFWHVKSDIVTQQWLNFGGVSQVASYDGSIAAALHNDIPAFYTDDMGAILHGWIDNGGFSGGVPFAARPDSLIGYFNYDIAQDDSAVVIIFFKKNGNVNNSPNLYYIVGSSSGSFQRLSFPITFTNSDVPDSVILAIVGCNPFTDPIDTGNYIAVDNISFAGTSLNVPNNDFEMWKTETEEVVGSWISSGYNSPIAFYPPMITKVTDKQHGDYAMKLENRLFPDQDLARTVSGNIPGSYLSSKPTFAVNSHHLMFNGYLKYFPQGGDTAIINIIMFKNGLRVGDANVYVDSTVGSYTQFFIPLNYSDPNVIPDSATIRISAGGNENLRGSILYIDNLGFDGFYETPGVAVGTNDLSSNKRFSWDIYPNPAQQEVSLKLTSDKPGTATVSFFDLSGKLVKIFPVDLPGGSMEFSVDLENMDGGYYVVALNRSGVRDFKKLVVVR